MPDMNWGAVLSRYDLFLAGAAVDIYIALASFALTVVIGLCLASMSRGNGFSRTVSYILVQIIRGAPLYVLLLWVYFGVSQVIGINIPPIAAVIIALGIATSGVTAEVFRSSFLALDKGQALAAKSLGMTRWQAYTSVLFPQAIRIALPQLGNVFVMQLKGATYAAVIGVAEAVFVAQEISTSLFLPFEAYGALAIVLVLMAFAASFAFNLTERRLKIK